MYLCENIDIPRFVISPLRLGFYVNSATLALFKPFGNSDTNDSHAGHC